MLIFGVASMATTKAEAPDKDIIVGLQKGLAVLGLFAAGHKRLTVSAAAQGAGLSRAAARRVLKTLERDGYVTGDGKFHQPTMRVMRLASGYLDSRSIGERVQPLLDRISAASGESASAAVLDGPDIVYVARASTRAKVMSIALGVGSRLPAYATSMGRVLLSYASETTRTSVLQASKLERLTPRTTVDPVRLATMCQFIRTDGFALVDEELELGLRSIAVPLIEADGQVEMAINISVPAAQMSAYDMRSKLLPILREVVG